MARVLLGGLGVARPVWGAGEVEGDGENDWIPCRLKLASAFAFRTRTAKVTSIVFS